MEHSTPSSVQSNPLEPESLSLDKLPQSLDEIIEQSIAGCGWPQFVQALLVSMAWIFDAQQVFISIYTDAVPTWHCTNDTCNTSSNICTLPRSAWAWNYPAHKTIISDWGLECSGTFITSLPTSSFFMGSVLSGFLLSTLADSSLGRKDFLFLSYLTMSIPALLTTFSSNIWIYAALRFVSGIGRASIGSCALVLSAETIGKQWRNQVGIIGFLCFTTGFISLPAIAYINRESSWKTIYEWTAIPAIFYGVLIYSFVHESPRWLFMQGHKEKVAAVLRRYAPPKIDSLVSCLSNLPINDQTSNGHPNSSIKNLFHKKWASRRLLGVMVLGFGIGMMYYGMPLGIGNLGFNIYLGITFNALSEVLSDLFTSFFISKCNRRSSLLVFCILSGASSVICALIDNEWKGLKIGLETVSFFSACTAFAVILIYTMELFPTCVRNFATSMVRQAIVVAGMLSPVLISAGRTNRFLSYGVFGLVITCCGLFVFCLPETRGANLCDTMDEQERREYINNGNNSV